MTSYSYTTYEEDDQGDQKPTSKLLSSPTDDPSVNGHSEFKFTQRFLKWRTIVTVMLIIGYTANYFNRTNLSVCTSTILEDTGLNKTDIGVVLSIGNAVYAVGKVTNGILIDYLGGKWIFISSLIGMAGGTIGFTFFDTVAGFSAMWGISRYFGSMAWGALVKILSRWFAEHEYGRIMGLMSISYMFGDAMIRLLLGQLLNTSMTWQDIYYMCAAIGVFAAIICVPTIKEHPAIVGEEEPKGSNVTVFETKDEADTGADEENRASGNLWTFLKPLLFAPKFWLLLLLSLLLTLIRETFNSWTPTYLTEELGMSDGDAASASMVFPLAGTVSAITGGFLVDRVPKRMRAFVPIIFLTFLTISLLGLAAFAEYYIQDGSNCHMETTTPLNHVFAEISNVCVGNCTTAGFDCRSYFDSTGAMSRCGCAAGAGPITLVLSLIAIVAFFLVAPYSFLDGVFSLELAGKKGCAAAVSTVNSAGYVGAILSGYVIGVAADGGGWGVVFLMLAGIGALAIVCSVIYWILDLRDLNRSAEK